MPKRLDGSLVSDGFNFDGANTVLSEHDVTKILPDQDNKVDLGSPSKKFKNIYYSSLTPDPGTGYLPLSGGTMTGGINLNSHELKNVTTISGQFTSKQVDNIVTSAGSSLAGNVATYFDSTGLVLANSLVSADNIVTNTGGAVTTGNVAIFGDSGGRNIANSFVPYTNLVTNTGGAATSGQVATYSGTTGKLITNSTTPILGTPASGTLTNCVGLPITGVSGMGANVASFLQAPSSALLAAAFPAFDINGTGNLVYDHAPDFTGATQRLQPLKLSTLTQYEAISFSTAISGASWIDANSIGTRFYAANTTQVGVVIKFRGAAFITNWGAGGTLTMHLYVNGVSLVPLAVPTTGSGYVQVEFDLYIRSPNTCRAQGILHSSGKSPVIGDGFTTWTKSASNNVDVVFTWSVPSASNTLAVLGLTIETHYQR